MRGNPKSIHIIQPWTGSPSLQGMPTTLSPVLWTLMLLQKAQICEFGIFEIRHFSEVSLILSLCPIQRFDEPRTFSLPWQNEHVAACLQESFGLALSDAIQDVLNSCHLSEQRWIATGVQTAPVCICCTVCNRTDVRDSRDSLGKKISPSFFRISDFKNWTQIKAGEKQTNHNKSQQIKVKQITFVNICKVCKHFRVPTPSYADCQDPHRQSQLPQHSSPLSCHPLLTGFFEKKKHPEHCVKHFFLTRYKHVVFIGVWKNNPKTNVFLKHQTLIQGPERGRQEHSCCQARLLSDRVSSSQPTHLSTLSSVIQPPA